MAATGKLNRSLAIIIPFIIFLSCFAITLTGKFNSNQLILSNAILGDLLITAPLAYFLLIRKSSVSAFTVIRVFVIGVFVAGIILNAQPNSLLHFIKTWISPLAEATIIFFVAKKFYDANKLAKQAGNARIDFLEHCRKVMYTVTGSTKAGNIISSEIAVFYYAFIARKDKYADYKTRFTSYKENGILTVLGAILFLFLIETSGVHFLLMMWSRTGAWILTGLSLYTCMQLFAHMKAVKARSTNITGNLLEIHNGLAGDAYIYFDNIERFELSNKFPAGRNAEKISLLKTLENHNCIVYLKKPIQVTKIFGIKKCTDTVLFFVDRPKNFAEVLNAYITTA